MPSTSTSRARKPAHNKGEEAFYKHFDEQAAAARDAIMPLTNPGFEMQRVEVTVPITIEEIKVHPAGTVTYDSVRVEPLINGGPPPMWTDLNEKILTPAQDQPIVISDDTEDEDDEPFCQQTD